MKRFRKFCIFFGFYFIFPLSIFEIYGQFKYFKELGERGYISRVFKSTVHNSLLKPNLNLDYEQSKLYQFEDLKKPNNISFRTDEYGTIYPTTFKKAINSKEPYAIFCGGSTLEASMVPENIRPTVIFMTNTKMHAVNASKSGKDIFGCISTIEFLLKKTNSHPEKIIIANNVNTLSIFTNRYKDRFLSKNIKPFLRDFILPGSYINLVNIREGFIKVSNNSKLKSLNKKKYFLGYSDYEKQLLNGCCHGASYVNKKNHKQFKWISENSNDDYSKYLKKSSSKLEKLIKEVNFDKSKIFIFIEPNSYFFKTLNTQHEFRQNLYSFEGEKYSLKMSGEITNKYDEIYKKHFQSLGFNVLSIDSNNLNPNDFYDAVHLTPTGARKIGLFFKEKIMN